MMLKMTFSAFNIIDPGQSSWLWV